MDDLAPALSEVSRKICLLGDFGVGKSSLVARFVHRTFSEKYQTTVGVRIDTKAVITSTRSVKLVIWDIAGASRSTASRSSYLRGVAGALIVADGTRSPTIEAAYDQIDQLRALSSAVPWIGLINKSDRVDQWELSAEQPMRTSGDWRLTSAATGAGVDDAFVALAERIERGP